MDPDLMITRFSIPINNEIKFHVIVCTCVHKIIKLLFKSQISMSLHQDMCSMHVQCATV